MSNQEKDDLFYLCSLIEYIGRKTKNHRGDVVKMIGKEELNKQLVGKSEYYNQELLGDSYYEMLDDVEDKSKLDE